jgi:hypothetical protein
MITLIDGGLAQQEVMSMHLRLDEQPRKELDFG